MAETLRNIVVDIRIETNKRTVTLYEHCDSIEEAERKTKEWFARQEIG